jgi:membrane-associated phospholipid phosphatase
MNTHFALPSSQRLKTFTWWGIFVGIAFFAVYPTTNWVTSLREDHFVVYSAAELQIPFVASFIWLYLSMYLLFTLPPFFLNPPELKRLGLELIVATVISGLIFLVFPAKLGFSRVIPEQSLYRDLYAVLFSVDHPFNLLPSLHVVYSSAIAVAIARNTNAYLRAIMLLWLSMIVSSTVLVHQHHIADVIAGLLLTASVSVFMGRRYA